MYTLSNYQIVRGIFLSLAALSLGACSGGSSNPNNNDQPLPEPYSYQTPTSIGDGWAVDDAAAVGVSRDALERIINDVRRGRFPIIDAVAVARHDKLILSETIRTGTTRQDERVNNVDPDMHAQNSVSKSFVSALIGIALEQGLIEGVDVPYLSLFPYPTYANDGPRKQAMTLEDVITMRTGLDWNEWDPPYSDPDNQMFEFYSKQTDFSKGLLNLPMVADPGTRFAYATPASVSLGQAIENVAPLSLIDYGSANFLAPLQITRVKVEQTPTGLPDLGRGLFLTTRDLLKLGQLFLNQGEWNGTQVVSADWVARSTTAQHDITWVDSGEFAWQLEGYAYQWWTGAFDIDGVRIESYAAWGFGEQWLMVIPAYDLVVAVNSHGEKGDFEEANQALELIKQIVVATEIARAN